MGDCTVYAFGFCGGSREWEGGRVWVEMGWVRVGRREGEGGGRGEIEDMYRHIYTSLVGFECLFIVRVRALLGGGWRGWGAMRRLNSL